jgi:hypothetical protein
MVQRSRGYKDYLWIGGLLVVLGPYAVLHFPCAMPQTFRGSFNKTLGSAVVGGLLVWAYVFEFMHYYIDSFVFRMKDPLVRLNIGPLLGQPNKILVVK